MKSRSIVKFLLFTALSTSFVACNEEFTEMGSEIIDSDQFGFDKYVVENIVTTNTANEIANTRNLPINNFGVYTHNAFGKTSAHFVTQIEMKDGADLTLIGKNPILDSVYVYIPYTSSVTATDGDGNKAYDLSNIY